MEDPYPKVHFPFLISH